MNILLNSMMRRIFERTGLIQEGDRHLLSYITFIFRNEIYCSQNLSLILVHFLNSVSRKSLLWESIGVLCNLKVLPYFALVKSKHFKFLSYDDESFVDDTRV